MYKKLSLIAACMSMALAAMAENWKEQLVNLNPDVIDKVVTIKPNGYGPATLSSYWIYYHQPLVHDEPELGTLPLRALLTIRNTEDFTHLMTQVNIGGYSLSEYYDMYPNWYADYYFHESGGELAGRYGGNLLQPEHRYFGKSAPEAPWSTLGYCEAKEAAADFHALIEAMKKVFVGKWAISGVSKGGTTTAIQHAFYPEDADCFVPYSGPFLHNVGDTRMQERWMTQAWNTELREAFCHIQKEMLNRPNIYKMFKSYYNWDDVDPYWDDLLRCYMLSTVGLIDCDLHAYESQSEAYRVIQQNNKQLEEHELEDYSDEMLLFMLATTKPEVDDSFDSWYRQHFYKDEEEETPEGVMRVNGRGATFEHRLPMPVYGIEEKDYDADDTGYWYQAAHELGYFDLKWDFFYDTQEEIDSVNAMWSHWTINVMMLGGSTFDNVVFEPEMMEDVFYNTGHSDRPVLFIYGNDDIWTGAGMPCERVNGDNIRQYVLPNQNHGVSINAVTDPELQAELWAFTDSIFSPETEAIQTTLADRQSGSAYYDLWGRKLDATMLRNRLAVKKNE